MNTNIIYNEECLQEMSKRIPDDSIDMILADLPYAISNNNTLTWDTMIPLNDLWNEYHRVIKFRGAIVLTATEPFATELIKSNKNNFKYKWIWIKNRPTGFMNARHKPLKKFEEVLVFSKAKTSSNQFEDKSMNYFPQGLREVKEAKIGKKKAGAASNARGTTGKKYMKTKENFPDDVLYFDTPSSSFHPTQKPVALSKYLIKTYTNKGDVVLDNVIGSGTTAVAAKALSRKYIGFEQDEEYYEIAQKRISEVQKELI